MDKLAQGRGFLNKLREKSNISGRVLESINPDFQHIMDRLRSTDEKIRDQASELKTAVRAANSYVRRRDYLMGAHSIAAFHERCRYIAAILDKFKDSIDMKHYKFLLDQFDDEQKQQLFGYDPTKEIKLEEDNASVNDADIQNVITAALKKDAGAIDWLTMNIADPISDVVNNFTNERGIAMRGYEKRFNISFLKELKTKSIAMADKTERFFRYLVSTFKRLATALATRNVNQYIILSKDFIKKFAIYHGMFVEYYSNVVAPLKEQHQKVVDEKRMQEVAAENQKKEDERKEQEKMQEGIEKQFPTPTSVQPAPQQASVPKAQLPSQKEKNDVLNRLDTENEMMDHKPFPLTNKKSHSDFIGKLEIVAMKNDPKLLANEILKYSELIEDDAPEESLKLLSIAEGLLEDKTAGVFDFLKPKEQQKEQIKPIESPEPTQNIEQKVEERQPPLA
jgi:hypothetical protein